MPTVEHAKRARIAKKKRGLKNVFGSTTGRRRAKVPAEQLVMLEQELAKLQCENAVLREVLYSVIDQDEGRIRASVARAQALQIAPARNKYGRGRKSVDMKLQILNEAKAAGAGYTAGIIRKYNLHPRTFYQWRLAVEKHGPKGLLDKPDRKKMGELPNTLDAVLDADREMQIARFAKKNAPEPPPLPQEIVIPEPPNASDGLERASHLRLNSEPERKVRFVGEPPKPRKSNRS